MPGSQDAQQPVGGVQPTAFQQSAAPPGRPVGGAEGGRPPPGQTEARRAWPKQVLWLNFPSSQHLNPDAEVEQATVAMLQQLDRPDGLIMGITEDMPEDRWRGSCQAIMDGLERHARENPGLYGKA